jgi:hypothetical protein
LGETNSTVWLGPRWPGSSCSIAGPLEPFVGNRGNVRADGQHKKGTHTQPVRRESWAARRISSASNFFDSFLHFPHFDD